MVQVFLLISKNLVPQLYWILCGIWTKSICFNVGTIFLVCWYTYVCFFYYCSLWTTITRPSATSLVHTRCWLASLSLFNSFLKQLIYWRRCMIMIWWRKKLYWTGLKRYYKLFNFTLHTMMCNYIYYSKSAFYWPDSEISKIILSQKHEQ